MEPPPNLTVSYTDSKYRSLVWDSDSSVNSNNFIVVLHKEEIFSLSDVLLFRETIEQAFYLSNDTGEVCYELFGQIFSFLLLIINSEALMQLLFVI